MSLFNTVNIVRFGGYNRGGRGTEHPLRFFLRKEYRGEDAVGELMRDFHCSDYRDMKNKTLASMVQYYKEDPEGVGKMCEAMDRIAEKRAVETRIENAKKMIARGKLTLEEIAEDSGLPLEKVKELADKRTA